MTPFRGTLSKAIRQLLNYDALTSLSLATTWYKQERQLRNLPSCCTLHSYMFFFAFISRCDLFTGEEKKLHIIKVHLQEESVHLETDWECATCNFLSKKTGNRFNFVAEICVCFFFVFSSYAVMPFPVYWELLPPIASTEKKDFVRKKNLHKKVKLMACFSPSSWQQQEKIKLQPRKRRMNRSIDNWKCLF